MSRPETAAAGEPSYAEAAAELDRIIDALDHEEIDVDLLGEQVARAADLIRLCRDRITRARVEVDEIVNALEVDLDGGG